MGVGVGGLDVNKQDDWRQRCKEQVRLCLTSFNQLFEREKWINHTAIMKSVLISAKDYVEHFSF